MISDPLPLSTWEELSVSPQSIDTGSNPGSIVHAANNQEFIVASTIEVMIIILFHSILKFVKLICLELSNTADAIRE